MWKLNPFTPKEPTSLEGRHIDIGNVKIYVRNAIAEGGFSCVYLARDAVNTSKQYALKHIICNDGEMLELVVKEISVMKMLKGHPNVVSLVCHTIQDTGRIKEALLVMEFCEMSLVTLLEKRGMAYLQEKQILSIFRDVCNAVFAMHGQSPPIAHRDLKAENILLGSDGAWKLCDFGSTSTKHKCYDRPEERGIEEDIIRKHTTPAYRAPEMWDLYRKEVISEKVDIWALGCLLYRICYLKSAFDGESKLQVLNGNYHIPEAPTYGSSITQLIKDMLKASPDARPDITQVWFRVNEQLPTPISCRQHIRNNPPQSQGTQKTIGAFWSSHHAPDTAATSFGNKESTGLKEQLKQAILEKEEIASKYEKLSSVCHSQRREIQELKRALAAAATPSPQPNMGISTSQISQGQKEKTEAGIWELEQAMLGNSFPAPSPSSQPWEAFTDEPKATPASNVDQSGFFFGQNNGLLFPDSTAQGSNDGPDQPLGWAGF